MAEENLKRGPVNNIALDKAKQKQFNQKVQQTKEQTKGTPGGTGVVYLSHLPWGFDEKPLKEYLKQFGNIKQLRISRSKKTGNSRGYGYVQFVNDQVAKIVAETMNNYLMFGKLIKCKHLENPHPKTFKNAKRKFRKPNTQEKSISRHNAEKSEEIVDRNKKRALAKCKQLQKKLTGAGVEYQIPSIEAPFRDLTEDDENTELEPKAKKMKTAASKVKASQKAVISTPKHLKATIPLKVDTPQGKKNVLIEDSSDDDITFKTPPFCIKSSKLTDSMIKGKADSPTIKSPSVKQGSVKSTPVKSLSVKSTPVKSPSVKSTPVSVSKTPISEPKSAATPGRTPARGLKRTPVQTRSRTTAATPGRTAKGDDDDSSMKSTGKGSQTPVSAKAAHPKTPASTGPKTPAGSKRKLKTPLSASKLR